MATRETVIRCALLAREKKGQDVRALDVRELAGFTDYFLLCSGASDRQVAALAEHIEVTLKKELGVRPIGFEGLRDGRWALIDYGDFVVHVFLSSVREFYNFDRLWGAASEVPLPAE
ncbi:MAG: ribosome silencing factor [Deltaproteobacteria bacterium]|nr:ribosome silencing factor [Deltaproteobacteria bacterium]